MTNAFLTEYQQGGNTLGQLFETLPDAFRLFQAALTSGLEAKLYSLQLDKPPMLITDTKFYK